MCGVTWVEQAEAVQEFLTLRQKINEILGRHCGKDPSQVEQDTERDRFMSAQEALDYGLVDKIISRHQRPTTDAGGEGKRSG